MIAVAERPTGLSSCPFAAHAGESASALAGACLDWASACWRGEQRAPLFATRLGAYWQPELPPQPIGTPDAMSLHGGGGRGIQWYETGEEIRGYVPGVCGGYRVPIAALPELVGCIRDEPRVPGDSGVRRTRKLEFAPIMAPKDRAHGF
jgi:hypothetical protein